MIDVENFINHEAEKDSVYLILQVHDELIFECPDDQTTIDATIALIKVVLPAPL